MKVKKVFTERLNQAFKNSGLSQQELSEKTKIPKSSISMYLSGKAFPRYDRVEKLAETLNVNSLWFYDIKSIEPNNYPYVVFREDNSNGEYNGYSFSEETIAVMLAYQDADDDIKKAVRILLKSTMLD